MKLSNHLRPALLTLALLAGSAGLSSAVAQTPAPAPFASADPSAVQSGVYVMEHDHSRIVWSVSHHGYSTFSGLLPYVTGKLTLDAKDPAKSQIEATVDMSQPVTGLPEFDKHVASADIFNAPKFPVATFKSTRIQMTSRTTARVTGDLTFMGVTKPVMMDVVFNQSGSGYGPPGYRFGFDGKMQFNRRDFGLGFAATFGDLVTLTIEAEFQKPAS